jgi:hypothetical protein
MTDQPMESPLAEASETSLDEFFSRRPPFDGGTLSALVTELRRMRVKWQSGEASTARKAPRAAKAKPSAIPLGEGDLWASEPEGEPAK